MIYFLVHLVCIAVSHWMFYYFEKERIRFAWFNVFLHCSLIYQYVLFLNFLYMEYLPDVYKNAIGIACEFMFGWLHS